MSVDVAASAVKDSAGQFAAQAVKTASLNDKQPPTFTVTFFPSNNTARVAFSEIVSNAAGGAVAKADFAVTISGGVATLADFSVAKVRLPCCVSPHACISALEDQACLTGVVVLRLQVASTVYTLTLSVSGIADGSETVSLDVASSAIKDAAGLFAQQNAASGTLIEKVKPTFSLTRVSKTVVTITFSEPVSGSGAAGAIVDADATVTITSAPTLTLDSFSLTPQSSTVLAYASPAACGAA